MLGSKIIHGITIEPALFICFIVSTISTLAFSNLMIQKLCYANGTGPVLGVICPEEVAVQKQVALMLPYGNTLEIVFKVVIIIISGNWTWSRKPFFLIPILGHILTDLLCLAATFFWQSSTWILVLGHGFLSGITGTGSLMITGCTLYASDNTAPEDRTLRIAVYKGLFAFSAPVGSLLSGYLTVDFGFYTVFLIGAVGNMIALILICFLMKETPFNNDPGGELSSGSSKNASEACKMNELGISHVNKSSISVNSGDKENIVKHVTEGEKVDKSLESVCNDNKMERDKADLETVCNDTEMKEGVDISNENVLGIQKLETNETEVNDAKMQDANRFGGTVNKSYETTEPGIKELRNGGAYYLNPSEEACRYRENRNGNILDRVGDRKEITADGYEQMNPQDKINVAVQAVQLNPFKTGLKSFRILLRPRGNHRTTIALLMILASTVLSASFMGEFSLLLLYVRAKFGWREKDYGVFAALKAWGSTAGVLFAIVILGRVYKVSDSTIGLLACVSDMLECFAYMLINTASFMYLIPLIDLFHGSAFIVGVSILTKEIDIQDLPYVLSTESILTTCLPLVTTPAYMTIYRLTVDVWPAAFNILGVVLAVPAFISFAMVKYLYRRRANTELRANNELRVNTKVRAISELRVNTELKANAELRAKSELRAESEESVHL
uniref:Uncharacterized protein n=1 Tax=Cacopsylla melanoneura TaxID=428564 RepID=A0A8D8QEP5_9HEMI